MTYLVNQGTVNFHNNIKKQRYVKHGASLTIINGLEKEIDSYRGW